MSGGAFPSITRLSLLPAFTGRYLVCVRRSCTSWSASVIPHSVGPRTRSCTALEGGSPSAPGALALVRVMLSRPVITYSAPHPRAHRDFTAWRLIRDAFAVRERRGDPRVVPSFRCTFLPDMPSSLTPGSSASNLSSFSMSTWPSPRSERLGTPGLPAIRSARGPFSGLPGSHICYSLSGCSPPCTDQTGTPSHRGLLLPGFQRIGLPPRCGI